jgi:hypothetical protein
MKCCCCTTAKPASSPKVRLPMNCDGLPDDTSTGLKSKQPTCCTVSPTSPEPPSDAPRPSSARSLQSANEIPIVTRLAPRPELSPPWATPSPLTSVVSLDGSETYLRLTILRI